MGILQRSIASYSNEWFTMPKNSRALRFIQDMQPANKMTIKNMESRRIVDEVAKAFERHVIYSNIDLYLDYDKFQLAKETRNLTTMKILLNLVCICTLS